MNLYLVARTDTIDYDEYDSFICAAKNENEARNIRPEYGYPVDVKTVTIKCIGTANREICLLLLLLFRSYMFQPAL